MVLYLENKEIRFCVGMFSYLLVREGALCREF